MSLWKQQEAAGILPESSLVAFYEVMTSKDHEGELGEPLQQCHHQRPEA